MGLSLVSDDLSSVRYSSVPAALAPWGKPTATVVVEATEATSATIPPTFPSHSRREDLEATAGLDDVGSMAEKASVGLIDPNMAQHRMKTLVLFRGKFILMELSFLIVSVPVGIAVSRDNTASNVINAVDERSRCSL